MSLASVVQFGVATMVLRIFVIVMMKIRYACQTARFPQPEDKGNAGFQLIVKLMTPLTMAYGPVAMSGDRCDAYVRNCVESELPVYVLASVWQSPPVFAAQYLQYMVYARIAHCVFFVLQLQPFRTLSYLPNYFVMGIFAVMATFNL